MSGAGYYQIEAHSYGVLNKKGSVPFSPLPFSSKQWLWYSPVGFLGSYPYLQRGSTCAHHLR